MDFIKGLMVEIGVDLKEFRAGLASAKKDLQGFGEQAKSIGGEFSKVSAVFAAAGGWAVKLAGDLEATSLSFRVLTKDAASAAIIQKQLNDYADKSPFEGNDVTLGGKRLIAYKFALRDVVPYLKDAGDLAATFADQGVKVADVAAVFGRLKSGDFGEAFARLRDFGIDRSQLEGQGLKFDKSGSYQGSVEAALGAVRKIIQKNYGGMADALGSTLPGMLATASDSITRFAQDIGTSIINTFDIKGLLGEFSGFLTSIKEGFNSLSPTVQKLILGFGALVVVLPPLLAIVGGIITAMPILTAGFAALTGPIGLVVAAIAVAAAAIIYHWDAIKRTLGGTTLWSSLKSLFKNAFGVIISIVGVFANAFQGDWTNMWEHAKNIVKYAWNGIVSMIQTGVSFVTNAFTKILGLVAPTNAAKLQGFFDKSIGAYDGLKAKVPELTNALSTLKSGYDKLTGGATEFGDKAKDAGEKAAAAAKEATKALIEESNQRLKWGLDYIKDGRDKGGHGLLSEMPLGPMPSKEIKQQVSGVSNGQVQWTTGQSDAMKEYLRGFKMPTGMKAISAAIANGVREQAEYIQAEIQSHLDEMKMNLEGSFEGAFSGWKIDGVYASMKGYFKSIQDRMREMTDEQKQKFLEWAQNIKTIFGGVGDALGNAFSSFGEAIATGKNPFAAFGKSLLGSFGEMLTMIGKEMLKQAAALTALAVISGGALSPVAIRTGAAGAALVVAGSAIKTSAAGTPKFADGWGGATGATMAWFGDNTDARTNQEFILRKDQVKSILNRAADSAGMGKGMRLETKISARDIKLILAREEDFSISLG